MRLTPDQLTALLATNEQLSVEKSNNIKPKVSVAEPAKISVPVSHVQPGGRSLKPNKRPANRSRKSSLEVRFLGLWFHLGGCQLETEYQFHPARKWRFDFAVIENRLAIEIEGGTWLKKGGHTTGLGYAKNCEKYNAATLLHWKVFRLTCDMLNEKHLRPIIELFNRNSLEGF